MSRRLLSEIGKSQRITVIETLKRRGPMGVLELSSLLKMSYMGVKQHCIDLHKSGYLDTWRKPGAKGRPQMMYRLTEKAQNLYERADNHLSLGLLEASKKLFGSTAAEKLLFHFFQEMAAGYSQRIKGDTVEERARRFAKLRDEEGYVTEFLVSEEGGTICEHHHLYMELLETYPVWDRLETEMVQRLLGTKIRRNIEREGGTYRSLFIISGR